MPPKYSRELSEPVAHGPRLRDQFRTSPCEHACPAGNSIQKMQALAEKGEFSEALRYLRAKNPFPGVTGRVCPHFCMDNCNRSNMEGCVNTRALERACADFAACGSGRFCNRPATGKKIAIAGGGPAGLTSAYFLALLGHEATVYEARSVLGGLPRYGVPNFRLPRYIVDREVGQILEHGVRALVNTRVGEDISLAEIRARHDAVIIATGLIRENSLPIPGADAAVRACEFLHDSAMGFNHHQIGETVVVMGGGGVGFDCAFTARRLGAKNVHVICLEKEGEMRAPAEDIEQAAREGIQIHPSCTMSGIRVENGKVTAADYFRVRECSFDEKGKLSLVPEPDGESTLPCDTVIFAVGMKPDLDFLLSECPDLALTPRKWIQVDEKQATSQAGIFAAGDISAGPASIARAIGDGRRAAFAAHAWLTGEDPGVFVFNDEGILEGRPQMAGLHDPYVVPLSEIYGIDQYERANPQKEKLNDCEKSFAELNLGFTADQAMAEAARCFHCGHCKGCGTCVDDCPGYVLEMKIIGELEKPFVEFGDECWHCGNCRTSCPTGAIAFSFPLRMRV